MHPPPLVAVIDRDRLTAYGLALLLRDWGYETVVGVSATEIYGRSEGAGRWLSAIVADDRGDSDTCGDREAAALARLADRRVPTILLVSTGNGGGIKEADAGGFARVPKPVEPDALRTVLRRIVEDAKLRKK